MSSQGPEKAERAYQVLTWVVHATKPLKLQELQCALSIEPESEDLDPEAMPDMLSLISACVGLVIIDSETSIVPLFITLHGNILSLAKQIYFLMDMQKLRRLA